MFILIDSWYGDDNGFDLRTPKLFTTIEQARKEMLSLIYDDLESYDIDCPLPLEEQLKDYLSSGSIEGWEEEIKEMDFEVASYAISIDDDIADLWVNLNYGNYESRYSIFDLEKLQKKQERGLTHDVV